MNLVSERGANWRVVATGLSLITLALVALAAFAARAQAAETIYWNNYGDNPDTIGFANIDGSGGGELNLSGIALEGPEGMAYDSVTNRLFVAADSSGTDGQIIAVNADGSGASVFTAPGAPVNEPEGITLDPATRTVYWINTKTGSESLAWALLDGSAGGVINSAGASLQSSYRLALDPIAGRLYWGTNAGGGAIQFANLNGTGGGTLDISGAPAPSGSIEGIAVDPAGNRVYWLSDGTESLSFASLSGGGGGTVNWTGLPVNSPWGLAFDPSLGRLYWGNESNGEDRIGAFGFANLAGGGGGINIATAPVANPQDPVILKSPTPTGAPAIARNAKARAELACSAGGWGSDYPGSFVYQAPRSLSYRWTLNGMTVAGATAATHTATLPGSYVCTVTATNQVGSAEQSSALVKVAPPRVKLVVKKKAKAQPGQVVTFKVRAKNQGDLTTVKKVRVCVKLPKAAKADLKAPKCKVLGKVKSQGKKATKLKIKVGPDAGGTYKVKFRVKGSFGKTAKSKIVVR
ncbi:MAG: PKD domain-containing protein [Actinomycetota bacterium]|nr:PKD domain-containing protein [Actinomycetota bacterium]